ncbi:MAG: ABC transporter ATP-binding protein [Hyphomicrobiales bacterium]|nr:MAG: ABC transporter ATP-binding protein [Hyphomicrobiales bacterium]
MSDAPAAATVLDALRQIARFWRLLVAEVGARRLFIASALALSSGLSEGAALLFLVPLIQSLDPAGGPTQGPMTWLPHWLQRLGVQLNLTSVLAIFIAVAAARSLLNRRSDLYLTNLRLNFLSETRVRLYSAIAHANWSFLRRLRPADLLAALTAETDRLDTAVYYALQMPSRMLLIGAHIAAACVIAPVLTLAALAVGFSLVWIARGRLSESLRLGEALTTAYQDYQHAVSEFLAGLKIAKSYVAEEQYVSAFATTVDEIRRNFLSFVKSQGNARTMQEIAGACAVAVFLGVSAGAFHMPVAQVLVLALIFYRLLPLVQSLQQAAQELLHVAPAAQTILALLRDCSAARETPHGEPQQAFNLEREIRFEKVSFAHAENAPEALRDVTLRLPKGALTVLTGSSGAGKSTLLDLLAGLLSPTEGKIRIDDRELIGELAQLWRQSIAYVAQDPFLFHSTIRANLSIAKPHASQSELREALTLAGAAGFVDALPEGLETIVGDRGTRFSGGERQRLALARALLRRPALLILDEPTSSLDEANERMVLEGIEALVGRVTMVLVTHRPARVGAACQVLRLEQGRLIAPA